jgi:hypothetical protein
MLHIDDSHENESDEEYEPTKEEIQQEIAREGHQTEVPERGLVNVWVSNEIDRTNILMGYLKEFEYDIKFFNEKQGNMYFDVRPEQALSIIGFAGQGGDLVRVDYDFEEPAVYILPILMANLL